MTHPVITPDDLMDIVELTEKLMRQMTRTLGGQDMKVAMSALICSTIKCILANCSSHDEATFYRESFYRSFDHILKEYSFNSQA